MNQYTEAVKQQKLSMCPELRKIPLIYDGKAEISYYCQMDECACQVEYQNKSCETFTEIVIEWVLRLKRARTEKRKLRIVECSEDIKSSSLLVFSGS